MMIHCDVRYAVRVGLVLAAMFALSAGANPEFSAGGASSPSAERTTERSDAHGLDKLHAAAARFFDGAAARDAGYARCSACLDDAARPGGVRLVAGIGPDEVGAALEEPRILVYEPRPDGELRLIGVEYVVPAGAWHDAGIETPPTLFGRAFARTDAVLGEPAYVLFVSVERLLPAGGLTY